MKKSYNPFKMWGSWIGLIISAFTVFSFYNFLFSGNLLTFLLLLQLPCSLITSTTLLFSNVLPGYLILTFHCIYGFLIGWGIHSLFRRLR